MNRKVTLHWDGRPVATAVTNESHLGADDRVDVRLEPIVQETFHGLAHSHGLEQGAFRESTLLVLTIEPTEED